MLVSETQIASFEARWTTWVRRAAGLAPPLRHESAMINVADPPLARQISAPLPSLAYD